MKARSDLVDMTGRKLGRLTVLHLSGRTPTKWACKCDCGAVVSIAAGNLRRNNSPVRSCKSCSHASTNWHRTRRTRTYISWERMISRCLSESCPGFRDYGGRGIRVCDRWKDFTAFYEDMGDRPKGTTLGRINNDGDYEPGNCRWETHVQQARNKRNTRKVSHQGLDLTLAEWSERTGIKYCTLWSRWRRGLDPSSILSPV